MRRSEKTSKIDYGLGIKNEKSIAECSRMRLSGTVKVIPVNKSKTAMELIVVDLINNN